MIRLVPLLIAGVSLAVSFAGCASVQSKTTDNSAGARVSAKNSSTDLKSTESKALAQSVESLHTYSIFGDSDPRLFDQKTMDQYPSQFARLYCGSGVSQAECAKKFDNTVFTKLSELYFAADPVKVAGTCRQEPLICDDLISLETLFRHLHNSGVEESKREKLNLIEDWRKGKMSDDDLKSALHMDFKFDNQGKLVLEKPSA